MLYRFNGDRSVSYRDPSLDDPDLDVFRHSVVTWRRIDLNLYHLSYRWSGALVAYQTAEAHLEGDRLRLKIGRNQLEFVRGPPALALPPAQYFIGQWRDVRFGTVYNFQENGDVDISGAPNFPSAAPFRISWRPRGGDCELRIMFEMDADTFEEDVRLSQRDGRLIIDWSRRTLVLERYAPLRFDSGAETRRTRRHLAGNGA